MVMAIFYIVLEREQWSESGIYVKADNADDAQRAAIEKAAEVLSVDDWEPLDSGQIFTSKIKEEEAENIWVDIDVSSE